MSDANYVVMKRAGQWSFTIDGDFYGPYQGQAGAEAAAISEAKHRGRIGETAQVSVDIPDDGMPVIFDTEDPLTSQPAQRVGKDHDGRN